MEWYNYLKYYLFQSDWKWILASFFMRFSGSLSILGSAVILYMILSDRNVKLKRVHNRILLGMSAFEIINSSAWLMSVSAVPKGTAGSYGAKGNQQTCTLQGFMLQVGLVVPFYSLSLCVYHYLVISRNVTDAKISRNVEPYMHIISILFPLSTAIAGIPLQLYNFNGAICYIMASPWECLLLPFTLPCTRNKHYVEYLIGFSGVWLAIIALLITVLMLLIYCSVRNRVRAMSRFNFRTRDGIVVRSSSFIQLCRDKRETGIQALLYVSAFLVTYIWAGINLIYSANSAATPDVLTLLIFFFQPLQGFWNFFIYIRPRYYLISNQFPQKSFWSMLMIAVFFPEESRRLSTNNSRRVRSHVSIGAQTKLEHVHESIQSRPITLEMSEIVTNSNWNEDEIKDNVLSCEAFQEENSSRRLSISRVLNDGLVAQLGIHSECAEETLHSGCRRGSITSFFQRNDIAAGNMPSTPQFLLRRDSRRNSLLSITLDSFDESDGGGGDDNT